MLNMMQNNTGRVYIWQFPMQHSKGHITVTRFITPINVFKLGRAKKSIAVYINLVWRQTATIQPLKLWLKYQTRK